MLVFCLGDPQVTTASKSKANAVPMLIGRSIKKKSAWERRFWELGCDPRHVANAYGAWPLGHLVALGPWLPSASIFRK